MRGTGGGQFTYTTNGSPYFLTQSIATDWMFTLRPRVGLAFDRALLYVTGGLAVANLKFNQAFSEPPFTPTPEVASLDSTRAGWVVGGGLEFALGGGWTIKGEYLYARFQTDAAVGQLVNANGSGPGCPGTFTCGATFTNNLSNLTVQTARAGLNYKFDWGGPVRAAY
jgi:outer membrane immunogenic protein